MKKEFIQAVKVLTVAILVGAGTLFVSAQSTGSWAPPPSGCTNPSSCNPQAPLNVSPINQTKYGGLAVAGSSGVFMSWRNSYLLGNTFVGLAAGGTGTGLPNITSDLRINGNTYVSTLTNSESNQVCADSSGKLVLCQQTPPDPTATPQTQIYTIANGVQVTSGSLGNSSPNTFTPPTNVKNIVVKMWGAGGGGGNYAAPSYPNVDNGNIKTWSAWYADGTSFPSGGGGGGGAYEQFSIPNNSGPISIVVGSPGAGGKIIQDFLAGAGGGNANFYLGQNGADGGSTSVGNKSVSGGGGGRGGDLHFIATQPNSKVKYLCYTYTYGGIISNSSPCTSGSNAGIAGAGIAGQSAGLSGSSGSMINVYGSILNSCVIFGPRGSAGLGGSGNIYGKGGIGGGGGGYTNTQAIKNNGKSSQLTSVIVATGNNPGEDGDGGDGGSSGGTTGGGGNTGGGGGTTPAPCIGQLPYYSGEDGQPGRVEITWDVIQ